MRVREVTLQQTGANLACWVAGTDLEGGLIAPSLQNLSDLLLRCIGRKENLQGLAESDLQSVLGFAKKCTIGAAFDKVSCLIP